MKLLSILSFLLFAIGCGGGLDPDVKPQDAGKHLRTALEAWKNGKASEDLQGGSPSIIMNETDWSPNSKLLDFTMDEQGKMFGRQVRWGAKIKLQDKVGKTADRKVVYTIDTIPRIVIVRDHFAPTD